MKLLSKVVWSEGMYLAPHHFQAQSRYFEDSVHFAAANLWSEAYGFTSFELDAEAIRNGTVAPLHARGIFPDGLLFDMPECDPLPAARNIVDAFPPAADSIVIGFAVARHINDGLNCGPQSDLEQSKERFISCLQNLPDENTGRDEKGVYLARKNIRLCLESELSDGLLMLPLARVMRDGSGGFLFDPHYIPPCVKLSASEALTALLQRLIEILEEKSLTLSRDRQLAAGQFQAGMSSGHVAQFWLLHCINSSLAPLRHLLLSKHGHPEELYREMARLAGALCTFGLDAQPQSLPNYDHNNLSRCFSTLDAHIREHLEIVVPSRMLSIPLRLADRYYFAGDIKDDRAFAQSRWILGVRSSLGEADLIVKAVQLIKICSAKFVVELMKRALPGFTLTHLPVPPASISARVDTQYFSISKSGPCWEHILKTKQVGVYVPVELPDPELELVVVLEA